MRKIRNASVRTVGVLTGIGIRQLTNTVRKLYTLGQRARFQCLLTVINCWIKLEIKMLLRVH